jgi:hypothetical protein
MNIAQKIILHILSGFIISLLLVTASFATTQFYLLSENAQQRIDCDYLEIQNNQAICTDNSLFITYDLVGIKNLEVVYEGKSFEVQRFTQETIGKINNINANKIKNKKAGGQEKRGQSMYTSLKNGITQQLFFDSLTDFVQSLKNRYRHQIGNTLNMILVGAGLVVFLIGSIGYLIATFRVGILWGLCCILLPFVSFIFLIVHWKVASKPFFVSMLGVAIIFLATLLVPVGGAVPYITKSEPVSLVKSAKVDGRYTCGGKIYCSEMTSCAEAKFYLQNCPGTKMDGDNDGVPCEKQWCAN